MHIPKISKIVLLLILIVLPFITAAQFGGEREEVGFTWSPETPAPNQIFSIEATSYSSDLNRAMFVWTLNGKEALRGIGKRIFTSKNAAINQKTEVKVSITTFEGKTYSKSFLLKGSDVDLIWESSAYAPAAYKGKTLIPHQDTVKITAIPHIFDSSGKRISSKNLIYKWKKNGEVQGTLSGFGNDVFTFQAPPIFKPIFVEIEVTSFDGTLKAVSAVNIETKAPIIRFYEDRLSSGVNYAEAITSGFYLKGPEIKLRAEPYFFGTQNNNLQAISFKWFMNGNSIPNETGRELILRKESGASGTARVKLEVKNQKKIFQYGETSATLIFD